MGTRAEIENKLNAIGIVVPESVMPAANYVPYITIGSQVVISGQLPMKDGKPQFIGKVGSDYTVEQGQECARLCGVNILSHLKKACEGEWGRVHQCVRLGVFVNSTEGFTDQPKVANGISDMMVEIFGKDIGAHARAAVGVAQLPFGVAVEVEALFELDSLPV